MVVQAGAVEKRATRSGPTPRLRSRLYQQFLEVVAHYPDSWLYAIAGLRGGIPPADGPGGGAPDARRSDTVTRGECALHYLPTSISHLLEQSKGHWSISRLLLDCHGGVRPAKHRMEEAVGDHRCSDVKGYAHDLQHGGLSGLTEGDRVSLYLCPSPPAQTRPRRHARASVVRVEEIEPPSSRREWGRAEFAVPDFEFINNCAYFDYQRDRIFSRTITLKRRQARKAADKARKPLGQSLCRTQQSGYVPFAAGAS